MSTSLPTIALPQLLLGFLPVAIVVAVLHRWSLESGTAVYALARMTLQLVLVGYVLTFIFGTDQPLIVAAALSVMLLAASWIALRPLHRARAGELTRALAAIGVSGVATLWLVTQGVLAVDPWYDPRFVIPLGGMIFANSMNTVSLAAERFAAEVQAAELGAARHAALRAAMIPLINSLFAVGIVSLPGMMTGQVLSGVDPLVAVRYQIMVMCMIFGSGGLAAALYLSLATRAASGRRDPKAAGRCGEVSDR